jgi:hypothetical protein
LAVTRPWPIPSEICKQFKTLPSFTNCCLEHPKKMVEFHSLPDIKLSASVLK